MPSRSALAASCSASLSVESSAPACPKELITLPKSSALMKPFLSGSKARNAEASMPASSILEWERAGGEGGAASGGACADRGCCGGCGGFGGFGGFGGCAGWAWGALITSAASSCC